MQGIHFGHSSQSKRDTQRVSLLLWRCYSHIGCALHGVDAMQDSGRRRAKSVESGAGATQQPDFPAARRSLFARSAKFRDGWRLQMLDSKKAICTNYIWSYIAFSFCSAECNAVSACGLFQFSSYIPGRRNLFSSVRLSRSTMCSKFVFAAASPSGWWASLPK